MNEASPVTGAISSWQKQTLAKRQRQRRCTPASEKQLFEVIIQLESKSFYPGPNINGLGVGHWGQRIVDGGLKEKGKV